MFNAFSAGQRAGFMLLAHSALARTLYLTLLLAALWGAIFWAEAIV